MANLQDGPDAVHSGYQGRAWSALRPKNFLARPRHEILGRTAEEIFSGRFPPGRGRASGVSCRGAPPRAIRVLTPRQITVFRSHSISFKKKGTSIGRSVDHA